MADRALRLPVLVECAEFNVRLTESSCARRYTLATSDEYIRRGDMVHGLASAIFSGSAVCASCRVGKARATGQPERRIAKGKQRKGRVAVRYRGKTAREWAVEFGVTEGSFRSNLTAYGLDEALRRGRQWRDHRHSYQREKYATRQPTMKREVAEYALEQLRTGRTGQDVAAELGVSAHMISALRRGKIWPELDREGIELRASKVVLSDDDAKAIARKLRLGHRVMDLAREYGISDQRVTDIKLGRSHRHLNFKRED